MRLFLLELGLYHRRLSCGYWSWSPDGFWWDNRQRYDARVGGDTSDRSRCGGSYLLLTAPASHGYGRLGAKYTPDLFGSLHDQRKRAQVGGANSISKGCGLEALYLSISGGEGYWNIGGKISTPLPSNIYTPDAFWHTIDRGNSSLWVGGRTRASSGRWMCGDSSLNLDGSSSHLNWFIGASLSYVSP